MHWNVPILLVIRAAGAIASALAGVLALLTQGAFVRRRKALGGWLSSFPMSRYRVTPYGATLLAIIFLAPAIQFVGDWLNDQDATSQLEATSSQIRSDIDATVSNATSDSRAAIVGLISNSTATEGYSLGNLNRSTADNLTATKSTLSQTQRLLQPLTDIDLSVLYDVSKSNFWMEDKYFTNVETVLSTLSSHPPSEQNLGAAGIKSVSELENGRILDAWLTPTSPLYPTQAQFPDVYEAAAKVNIELCVLKSQASLHVFREKLDKYLGTEDALADIVNKGCDINILTSRSIDKDTFVYRRDLTWLSVSFDNRVSTGDGGVRESGNIVSIPDLEAASAVIMLSMHPYTAEEQDLQSMVQQRLDLLTLTMKVSGRTYEFEGPSFKTSNMSKITINTIFGKTYVVYIVNNIGLSRQK